MRAVQFRALGAAERIDHDALDVRLHCGYSYLMNNGSRYGVFAMGAVRVGRDGSSAVATGDAESRHETFDAAYEAAQSAGGGRWVIGRAGDSEYVEVAS